MKKIIIATALLFGSTLLFAQKSTFERTQIVSNENPHNPLVNGIPYNQYKLQVQQENKKREEAKAKAKAELQAEMKKMSAVKLPPIEEISGVK